MERIWHKFHPLYGSNLRVGFETTFPKTADLSNLNPLYSKSGLVYEKPNESVIRIYEPATNIIGSCEKDEMAQVFFESVSPKPLFQRLVFFKRPQKWMIAARHDEPSHFGFNSHNNRNRNGTYLALAYPGLSKIFSPVFIKIQNGGDFIYLGIWAWNEDKKTVVWARKIDKRSEDWIPKPLIRARP